VLALTDNARTVIRDLTARTEVPGSGLRIAPTQAGELELSLVEAPAPGDEVIDSEGARLFLEQQTAAMLADQVLDARVGGDSAGFYLTLEDSAQHNGTGPAAGTDPVL
jgi:iron-sulfur cluster assembly protein